MSKKKPRNARCMAAEILLRVFVLGESFSHNSFERYSMQTGERAVASQIIYGVLRWRWRLEAILAELLQRSIRKRDIDIKIQLLIGLYQLLYMHTPDYAAVDETVSEIRALKKNWATSLANAVLRNYLRTSEVILAKLDQKETCRYSHPEWLIERIRNDWPDQWQGILEANNQRAPMWLRVNSQLSSPDVYLDMLAQESIAVSVTDINGAIALKAPVDVSALPKFEQGWVSVQDGGAQQAAYLMECRKGDRVLDACSAPGGKACHMLELQPGIDQLFAVDVDEKRLQRVSDNLARLSLAASLHSADLQNDLSWWDGELFDRILLDVPCSATGVIRRHPDIKSLRRENDIDNLSQTQAELLNRLWPMLKPGGRLLYVTCSVLRQENEAQILSLLSRFSDVREIKIEVKNSIDCTPGRQILPGEDNRDGYYFACLEKISRE